MSTNTIVSMNEDVRKMEQFNDIMPNVKSFGIVGKGKTQRIIMGSAVVLLSCCAVNFYIVIK